MPNGLARLALAKLLPEPRRQTQSGEYTPRAACLPRPVTKSPAKEREGRSLRSANWAGGRRGPPPPAPHPAFAITAGPCSGGVGVTGESRLGVKSVQPPLPGMSVRSRSRDGRGPGSFPPRLLGPAEVVLKLVHRQSRDASGAADFEEKMLASKSWMSSLESLSRASAVLISTVSEDDFYVLFILLQPPLNCFILLGLTP